MSPFGLCDFHVMCDVLTRITSAYHAATDEDFEEVQHGGQRMTHTLEAPTHHSPPWHLFCQDSPPTFRHNPYPHLAGLDTL